MSNEPRTHLVKTCIFMGGPMAGQSKQLKAHANGSAPYGYMLNKANAAAALLSGHGKGYYKLEVGTTLMHWTTIGRGYLPRVPGAFHEPDAV